MDNPDVTIAKIMAAKDIILSPKNDDTAKVRDAACEFLLSQFVVAKN